MQSLWYLLILMNIFKTLSITNKLNEQDMTKIIRKNNRIETFNGKFISKCNIDPFISGVVRCDRIYICESKNTKIQPMIE